MKRLSLLVIFAVSGCATLTPDSGERAPLDWADRDARLSAADQWEFTGRLAVKDLLNGDGTQANVRWRQRGEGSIVRLSGPFGSGAQEIYWEPESLRIVDAKGERSMEYSGASAAERFLQDQLGWSFPAESTRYWVRALRDPGAPGQELFNEAGELIELRQHGWEISYERYADFEDIRLPARLVMESASARLRIVMSKWSIAVASE